MDLRTAILLPQIVRLITSQMGSIFTREAVTNRLGVMNAPFQSGGSFTGAYQGQSTRDNYAKMLRGVGGYRSESDLYGGASILGQIGALRDTGPESQGLARQAGLLGRLTGTGLTGGAGIMGNLRSAPTVIGLQQLGVQVSPGGKMRAPSDIFEGLYGQVAGSQTGQGAKDVFRSGQAPGSGLDVMMDQLGFSPETKQAFLAFGAIRAQRGKSMTPDEFAKSVGKNIDNASENMRKFSESMAHLKDSLATTIIPAFTTLADALTKVFNFFGKFSDGLTNAQKALMLLAGAATVASVKMALGGAGGVGGLIGKVPGLGGLAGGGGAGILGTVGLSVGGGLAGSWAGGHLVKGHGAGHKAASVLGGAAGGAATGAAFGALGGPLGVGAGAVVGGVLGGITGLFGDPVNSTDVGDPDWTDRGLLANPPPAAGTAPGGPLRGGGNSANLNPTFVDRLRQMFTDNPLLSLTSGWRSHEEQAYLRWQKLTGKRSKPVAPVGTSKHESGYAADIGPPSQYKWLADHAPDYGLVLPMPGVEPWHWELPRSGGKSWSPPASGGSITRPSSTQPSATKKKPAFSLAHAAPSAASSGGTNEADWLENFFAGGGGGTARAGGGGGDMGDAVAVQYGMPSTGGATSVTIHHAEFNVTIAKGTPEEAERVARYLMEILSDRTQLQELARR